MECSQGTNSKSLLFVVGNDVLIGYTFDIYDISKPGTFEIGAGKGVSGINSTRGTLYIDEIILLDDSKAIGPNLNTWEATLTTETPSVWMDDLYLTNGSDKDSLNDHEWFWEGNKLYVRDNTGDPDGSVTIEAGQRVAGIYISGKDYITISDLECSRSIRYI